MANSETPVPTESRVKVIPYYLGHFFVYLGLLIIAVVVVGLVIRASRIYAGYQDISENITTLETLASSNLGAPDLVQTEAALQRIVDAAENLQQELTPFLPVMPYLGLLPVYGGNIQAAPELVTMTHDVGQVGLHVVEIVAPALSSQSPSEPLPYLTASLTGAESILAQDEARLRRHAAMLEDIDAATLSPPVARRVTQLKDYLPQLITGLQVAQLLPGLLGAETPQTYLILTQNSDELRPGGGYINTAGHIVFDHGRIVEFVMQDSYAIDRLSETYPYPPDPLYEIMAADYWVLRDASWSPDFPATAQTAMTLYELGQGVAVDGVIAFDQHALPFLLEATEPVRVEGETVSAGNVIQLMQQHWAPEAGENLDGAWWGQRKSFMLALAETLRLKFEQDFAAVNLTVLANNLKQTLAEKHGQIYLKDPTASALLAEKEWSGALKATPHDYLMVVDANVGFNKASALVERQVQVDVQLGSEGQTEVQVTLTYHHPGQQTIDFCYPEMSYDPTYQQNMARCYWNYGQLIVPAEAQLIAGPQNVVDGKHLLRGQSTTGDVAQVPLEPDKVSWGQLFLLAPQETLTFAYHYTLPPGTASFNGDHWEYSLYLQKQTGTMAPPVEVTVTLPEQAQLLDIQPAGGERQKNSVTYQFDLVTNQKIKLSYALR